MSSAVTLFTLLPFLNSRIAAFVSFSVIPSLRKSCPTLSLELTIERKICSSETNSSPKVFASETAFCNILFAASPRYCCPPLTFGKLSAREVIREFILSGEALTFFRIKGITFSSTSIIPCNK